MADPRQSVGADNINLGDLTDPHCSSSPSDDHDNSESVLASFRNEWRRELETSTSVTPTKSRRSNPRPPRANQSQEDAAEPYTTPTGETQNKVGTEEIQSDTELKATELFNKAVELERSSRLYEAIQHYRRAMTLVPDIEFRVHRQNMLEGYYGPVASVLDEERGQEEEQAQEDDLHLVASFQALMTPLQAMCSPQYDQDAPHISCLPPEMLDRILCWVIGNDLDMGSLEQVSQVCRGFYMLSRNKEIWHKACLKVWGPMCELSSPYPSWRDMFIKRPHPRYNGCYISRTSYFRSGDCSYQDQNYQPWHLVHYYRYIRFYTDGRVCMLTSPDEPSTVVSHLRAYDCKFSQMIRGHYKFQGSNIILSLKKISRERMINRRKNRKHIGGTTDVAETNFVIEFEIRTTKKKPHWVLQWINYSICYEFYDNRQTFTDVDVNDSTKFPSLAFSRVKSYTYSSDSPLT